MSRDGVVVPLGRQRRVGREVKSRGVPDNGACGNGGNGDGGGVTSLGCSGGGGVGECTGHITQHFLRARRQNPRRREEEGDAATSFAAAWGEATSATATLQQVTVSKTAATSKTDKTFSGEGGEGEHNRASRRPQGRRAGRRRRRPCKTSAAAASGLETKLLLPFPLVPSLFRIS